MKYMGSKNRIAKHLIPIMVDAADDFECVWQGVQKTNFASNRSKATHNAVEKLFTLK